MDTKLGTLNCPTYYYLIFLVISPLFNRCVIFLSELMLHRVLPSVKTRYCFSIWIDKHQNGINIDDLMLSSNKSNKSNNYRKEKEKKIDNNDDNENENDVKLGGVMVNKDLEWLCKPTVQCTLSRWVYENEYIQSLKDCIVDEKSNTYLQLYEMHINHLNNLKESNKSTGLIDIVEWLKKNKPDTNDYIKWDSI